MPESQAVEATQHVVQSRDVFVFKMSREITKDQRETLQEWWRREWAPSAPPSLLLVPKDWRVEHERDGKPVMPFARKAYRPVLHKGQKQAFYIIAALVLSVWATMEGNVMAAFGWLSGAICALTCDIDPTPSD